VESTNRNRNPWGGLRCHTLVVVQDAAGRAIWVSDDFEDPTRCGLFDPACASDGVSDDAHTSSSSSRSAGWPRRWTSLVADAASFVDLRKALIEGHQGDRRDRPGDQGTSTDQLQA
jgi:hypothetical protein